MMKTTWNIIFSADLDTPSIKITGESLKKIDDHTISIDGVEIDLGGEILGIFRDEDSENLISSDPPFCVKISITSHNGGWVY